MGLVIKILGYVLLAIGALFIFAGTYGVWRTEGFGGVQDLYSPFNIINWLVTVATLAPGFLLIMCGNRLSNRRD